MSSVGQVLVTGASCFVDSAVAKALVEAGFHACVGASDEPARISMASRLCSPKVTCATRNRFAGTMAGVRYLFHIAADYRLWARDPSEIAEVNVAGTRTIMTEALRGGAARGGEGDRRLQAQQGRRRAAGRGNDRKRRPARHHRQPVHPDRYILGGENVLFSDMLVDISTMVGRPPPRWRFPAS
ncbi:MAG TPA: NAD-dependent epimerase/dehydratase family protein [Caldimonas sp.]